MFSTETQTLLADFLKSVAETDMNIESSRLVLVEKKGYEPRNAFCYIDKLNKGYIEVEDFREFLSSLEIEVEEEKIRYIFYTYDSDNDFKLSYTDFKRAFLPNSAHKLLTEADNCKEMRQKESLTYAASWALAKIFEKEISAFQILESKRNELVNRPDWKVRLAFEAIDRTRSGFADEKAFEVFLKSCGKKILLSDITGLMRHADKDGDGKVSFSDFANLMHPMHDRKRLTRSVSKSQTSFKLDSDLDKQSGNSLSSKSMAISEKVPLKQQHTYHGLDYSIGIEAHTGNINKEIIRTNSQRGKTRFVTEKERFESSSSPLATPDKRECIRRTSPKTIKTQGFYFKSGSLYKSKENIVISRDSSVEKIHPLDSTLLANQSFKLGQKTNEAVNTHPRSCSPIVREILTEVGVNRIFKKIIFRRCPKPKEQGSPVLPVANSAEKTDESMHQQEKERELFQKRGRTVQPETSGLVENATRQPSRQKFRYEPTYYRSECGYRTVKNFLKPRRRRDTQENSISREELLKELEPRVSNFVD